jgi:hypothetical protein
MDERQPRPLRPEACHGFFAPVRRAVVGNPEDAARGPIRLGGHHLLDEPVDGANRGLGFTPAEQFSAMHIPRGEVRQRTRSEVLVFDAHRTTRTGCQRRMLPAPRLETRFLIGRDDVFIASQCGPFPSSAIQIQDTTGFLGELGIAGKDPAAMPPGLQRIGAQPAPQGDAADLRHDAAGEYLTM